MSSGPRLAAWGRCRRGLPASARARASEQRGEVVAQGGQVGDVIDIAVGQVHSPIQYGLMQLAEWPPIEQ